METHEASTKRNGLDKNTSMDFDRHKSGYKKPFNINSVLRFKNHSAEDFCRRKVAEFGHIKLLRRTDKSLRDTSAMLGSYVPLQKRIQVKVIKNLRLFCTL